MKHQDQIRLGNRLRGTLANPPWSFLLVLLFLYGFTYQTGDIQIGQASWYSQEACRYNPDPKCPTASGRSLYELEGENTAFSAMWDIPFGTRVRVTNLANGKSVVTTVLDRGPAKRLKRLIDLSKGSFEKIADTKQGIIDVKIEVLSKGGAK